MRSLLKDSEAAIWEDKISENQLYKRHKELFSLSKLVYAPISAILQFEECNYCKLLLMVLILYHTFSANLL